jgi:hypothetical protein
MAIIPAYIRPALLIGNDGFHSGQPDVIAGWPNVINLNSANFARYQLHHRWQNRMP